MGSQNCATQTNSCLLPGGQGIEAAASENIFGASSGVGPGCGSCWTLTTDAGASAVVKVNNLCPVLGNEMCSMMTPGAKNSAGKKSCNDSAILVLILTRR